MVDCPHATTVAFVAWEATMCTIDDRERHVARWCRDCGSLGVWDETGDELEWVTPGKPHRPPRSPAQGRPGAKPVPDRVRGWKRGSVALVSR